LSRPPPRRERLRAISVSNPGQPIGGLIVGEPIMAMQIKAAGRADLIRRRAASGLTLP